MKEPRIGNIIDIEDVKSESIKILAEGIFGKKKEEKSASTIPAVSSFDDIEDVMDMKTNTIFRTINNFIEKEYTTTINQIKQENPELFQQFLVDKQGDESEEAYKSELVGTLLKQVLETHGMNINKEGDVDAMWDDTQSKNPFKRSFRDSLFDIRVNSIPKALLEGEFGDDLLELQNYYNAYNKTTTERGRLSKTGIAEGNINKRIAIAKLTQIMLGYMMIRDDDRFEKSYGQDGIDFINSEIDQHFPKIYGFISSEARKEANTVYARLKNIPASDYTKQGVTPYEAVVSKINNDIAKLRREVDEIEEENEEREERGEKINPEADREAEETNAASQNVPEEEEEQEEQEEEEEQKELTEKEQEVVFAKDPHHERNVLLTYESAKAVVDLVEHPENVNSLSTNEFRSVKTFMAQNLPWIASNKNEQEKENMQFQMTALTKSELSLYLNSIHKSPDMTARMLDAWNQDKYVAQKGLLTITPPSATETPKAEAPKVETPKAEMPKEVGAKEVVGKIKSQTAKPEPKTEKKSSKKKSPVGSIAPEDKATTDAEAINALNSALGNLKT